MSSREAHHSAQVTEKVVPAICRSEMHTCSCRASTQGRALSKMGNNESFNKVQEWRHSSNRKPWWQISAYNIYKQFKRKVSRKYVKVVML